MCIFLLYLLIYVHFNKINAKFYFHMVGLTLHWNYPSVVDLISVTQEPKNGQLFTIQDLSRKKDPGKLPHFFKPG